MRHNRLPFFPAVTLSAAACIVAAPGARANQVPGDAPFINTWSVAGPFDKPMADILLKSEIPENANLAAKSSVRASSEYPNPGNTAQRAIDEGSDTWVSAEGDKKPALTLEWKEPVTVGRLTLAQWGDGRHVNRRYALTFTLADGTRLPEVMVDSTSPDPGKPTEYVPTTPLARVKSVLVEIDKGLPMPGITGLREVAVYAYPPENDKSDAAPAKPLGEITPAPGRVLGGKKWEYLDDRLWNRNFDDYQDLHGYYQIKQGVETRNGFVCAHTYVYSPKEQTAQFRVGASGSFRLFVNDVPVSRPSTPAEVQKDLVKRDITLRQGWNKLLVQIRHTFTEDRNANGVPVAKDPHVSFLGFYGRVSDAEGNAIPGLEYSLTGDTAGKLAIETRALDAASVGNALPKNALPVAYTEWPYVWNKSKGKAGHGVGASPFRFLAGGGAPGYRWSLVDSKLPEGLTLEADGTITGIVSDKAKPGEHAFTVRVTDARGATVDKAFTMTVKDYPTKWFEEGRVGALSHCVVVPRYWVDENFSTDLWADRARREGHSLVSIEGLQQNYYWPSKFCDPKHPRQQFIPLEANGQVPDGLKPFEEAVKRHGMKFGVYYATEGGGLGHFSTDVFVQNIEDIVRRYKPAYLYFDGPQAMPWANYDAMFSAVRNLSDEIIINSNAWGEEFGDPDLRTEEASHIYAGRTGASHLVKYAPMEPWRSAHTKHNPTPYYATRDDHRQIVREMVASAGRGQVENCDQMPLMQRGPNWDSPEAIATNYPQGIQEFITVRENTAAWFAPAGKPERHESTTGTRPYFLSGCGFEDDGKGNRAAFDAGRGPAWGYATARDNNLYLHILKGPDGRRGFDAIKDRRLVISPVKHKVIAVKHLNEGASITSFKQEGDTLTLDLTHIPEDPTDTIVKVVTDDPARTYKLTHLRVTGERRDATSLRVDVEGLMTYPALKARLEKFSFRSADPSVVAVDAKGLATAKSNGETVIEVTGTYEGVTKTDSLPVKVVGAKSGFASFFGAKGEPKLFVNEPLVSAALKVDGLEAFGEFTREAAPVVSVEVRSVKGGAVGLDAAEIVFHAGVVDLKGGTKLKPVAITESDIVRVENGRIRIGKVDTQTRAAVWASVKLGGQTLTTNKVFLDLLPSENLAKKAVVTASAGNPAFLTDGVLTTGAEGDTRKWSAPAKGPSWVAFDLGAPCEVKSLAVNFNTRDQHYTAMPAKIEVQASDDGKAWKTVSEIKPPAGHAWFPMNHIHENYPAEVRTRHLRLAFPEGGKEATVELLEVGVRGNR